MLALVVKLTKQSLSPKCTAYWTKDSSGWPVTWKSRGVPKWSGKMESQGKVRGSEIRCVFSSSKYSKTRFSAGALPQTPLGELTMLPRPSSQLGRGHPIPFSQLLQPQLLNNWLSGITLFFVNMKQRLLTISVNTRYRVIFACLYWKSQGISCGLESGHPDSFVHLYSFIKHVDWTDSNIYQV